MFKLVLFGTQLVWQPKNNIFKCTSGPWHMLRNVCVYYVYDFQSCVREILLLFIGYWSCVLSIHQWNFSVYYMLLFSSCVHCFVHMSLTYVTNLRMYYILFVFGLLSSVCAHCLFTHVWHTISKFVIYYSFIL